MKIKMVTLGGEVEEVTKEDRDIISELVDKKIEKLSIKT